MVEMQVPTTYNGQLTRPKHTDADHARLRGLSICLQCHKSHTHAAELQQLFTKRYEYPRVPVSTVAFTAPQPPTYSTVVSNDENVHMREYGPENIQPYTPLDIQSMIQQNSTADKSTAAVQYRCEQCSADFVRRPNLRADQQRPLSHTCPITGNTCADTLKPYPLPQIQHRAALAADIPPGWPIDPTGLDITCCHKVQYACPELNCPVTKPTDPLLMTAAEIKLGVGICKYHRKALIPCAPGGPALHDLSSLPN